MKFHPNMIGVGIFLLLLATEWVGAGRVRDEMDATAQALALEAAQTGQTAEELQAFVGSRFAQAGIKSYWYDVIDNGDSVTAVIEIKYSELSRRPTVYHHGTFSARVTENKQYELPSRPAQER